MGQTVDLTDDESVARSLLPPHVSAYFAAAAGSGTALTEGTADWSAVRFRPRSLRDVSSVDLRTTVLGTEVDCPVLAAPMAQQTAAHPEGEIAMARAVAAARGLLAVSTHTAVAFADIAATGVAWWFQVYLLRDRGLTELLVRRAAAAGARAMILTVDMMALLPSSVNPRDWPEGPAKARLGNLTADECATAAGGGLDADPSITFDDIGWLAKTSGLPVLVKGVLRADDAAAVMAAGAAGIIVSTHGARRMGASISSARALPEVVDAVAGAGEVYVDSGLRNAEHVAAALVMGARAVFVGRPLLWALAAGGEKGVTAQLGQFHANLRQAMVQLGASCMADLGRDLLATERSPRLRP